MTYETAFPDFDDRDHAVAAMALGFDDKSWQNDSCPSFVCDVFEIYIDYADVSLREFPEANGPRFTMYCEGDPMVETNDWADIVAFVRDGKRDFPEYSPWTLGKHEEICSLRAGGPVVAVDAGFAVVQLRDDLFYLIHGTPESYCDGSVEEGEAEAPTLAEALDMLAAAKAVMVNT